LDSLLWKVPLAGFKRWATALGRPLLLGPSYERIVTTLLAEVAATRLFVFLDGELSLPGAPLTGAASKMSGNHISFD
jgi:hypothetical protein